jgi:serine/threonine-protein kinase
MGEVYRARDIQLGRDVAIKVLPEAFVQDQERVARFEREAKLLAALNHPGIATLYGLEKHDGKQLLVMELVEGETLDDRIHAGPLLMSEAFALVSRRMVAKLLVTPTPRTLRIFGFWMSNVGHARA